MNIAIKLKWKEVNGMWHTVNAFGFSAVVKRFTVMTEAGYFLGIDGVMIKSFLTLEAAQEFAQNSLEHRIKQSISIWNEIKENGL